MKGGNTTNSTQCIYLAVSTNYAIEFYFDYFQGGNITIFDGVNATNSSFYIAPGFVNVSIAFYVW